MWGEEKEPGVCHHSQRPQGLRKPFRHKQSLNTSELLQFTPSSSPSPSSCKNYYFWSQGDTWSCRDSTSIELQKQCCPGDPALAEGILQRKPHTPITKPRMQVSHQQCCTHREVSGEEDVLWHCLFLCPALISFVPIHSFFCTKEGLLPPLQDPFTLQSTAWETRTAGKQRGVAQRKGQPWMSELGFVCTFWGKKALFKVHALSRGTESEASPTPAGERSSLGHPEPCPSPTTPQVARD